MCSVYIPCWIIKVIFLLHFVAFVVAQQGLLTFEAVRHLGLSLQDGKASKYSPGSRKVRQEGSGPLLVKRTSSGKNSPKVKSESPKAKPVGWESLSDSGSEKSRGAAADSPERSSARSPGTSARGSPQGSPRGRQRRSPIRSSGGDEGGRAPTAPQGSQGDRQISVQIPGAGEGLTMPQGTREGEQRRILPGPVRMNPGRQPPPERRFPRTRPPLDTRPVEGNIRRPLVSPTTTLPASTGMTSNAAAAPANARIGGRFAGAPSSAFQMPALNPGPNTSNHLWDRPFSDVYLTHAMEMHGLRRNSPSAAGASRPIHTALPHQQPLLRNDQPLLEAVSSRGSSSVRADPRSPQHRNLEPSETNPQVRLASQQRPRMQAGSTVAGGEQSTVRPMLPPSSLESVGSAVPRRPRNPTEYIGSISRQPSTQQPGAADPRATNVQPDRLPPPTRLNQLTAVQRALLLQSLGLIPPLRNHLQAQLSQVPTDQSTAQHSGVQQRPQAAGVVVAGSRPSSETLGRQPNLAQSRDVTSETAAVQRSRDPRTPIESEIPPSVPSSNQPSPPRAQAPPVEQSTVQSQGTASAEDRPDLSQWTAPIGQPTAAQLSRYRQEMQALRSASRGGQEGQSPPRNPTENAYGRVVSGQPRHGWGVRDWSTDGW